jgi:FkbM family methyltransferase
MTPEFRSAVLFARFKPILDPDRSYPNNLFNRFGQRTHMTLAKDNFKWSYTQDDDRITFAFQDHDPVHFDGTERKVAKWMTDRHKGGGMHEPVFAYVLARLLEIVKPKVYFDIGAYLGYFTLLPLTLVSRETCIYSFEMSRPSCELYRANLALNPHLAPSRVFLVNAGISGQTQFNQDVWVRGFRLLPKGPDGTTNASVDILTLDYIYLQMGFAPDLIKMDIEGFEAPALRAAAELLRTKRPFLIFELHSETQLQPHDATRMSVLDQLGAAGYTVLAVDGRRQASVNSDRPLLSSATSSYLEFAGSENSAFVAVPTERLDQIADLIAVPADAQGIGG